MLGLFVRVLAAAAASLATLGVGQARVNAPLQSGSITIMPQTLYRGCDDIVVFAPIGTPWSTILARVADPSFVVGIWKLDNAAQRYRSEYFPNSAAPTDGDKTTAESALALWFCVSAQSSIS
jgi:hypothetical protein